MLPDRQHLQGFASLRFLLFRDSSGLAGFCAIHPGPGAVVDRPVFAGQRRLLMRYRGDPLALVIMQIIAPIQGDFLPL